MKAVYFHFLFSLIAGFTFSQPNSKLWDKNVAGSAADIPVAIEQLADSGFIVLATSVSPAGIDKSDGNRDPQGITSDFWLIRLDKYGNIIWDKTYGGSGADQASCILVLPSGFILGGTSSSPVSGEKTDSLRGVADYWVIAVDTTGSVLWDKTIGGPLSDQLNGMVLTSDNKLMLSGWTLSGSGGDKISPALGDFDYWIVKLDLSGNLILENTLGGILADNCYAIVQAGDGGALLAGYSNSPVSFSKTGAPRGGFDFWLVRIDSLGRRLWDKTIGGPADDFAFTAATFPGASGGFLIGGDSFSGQGGEKSESNRGGDDYWLIRVLPNGNLSWDKTFGGSDYDELNRVSVSANNKILLSGESYSVISGDKTENNLGAEQIWMVQTDTSGQKIWDKTFFTGGHDEYAMAIPTLDNNYLGINFTVADTGGYRTFNNMGGGDIWLCKLGNLVTGITTANVDEAVFLYPNPAHQDLFISLPQMEDYIVQLFDLNGRLLLNAMGISGKCRLNLSNTETGIYTVCLLLRYKKITKKLIRY